MYFFIPGGKRTAQKEIKASCRKEEKE